MCKQKVKRVPVSFKSKKEFAKAMIEGRVFYPSTSGILSLYYDESHENDPFRFGDSRLLGLWESYHKLYEEIKPPWWESIDWEDYPNGILCRHIDLGKTLVLYIRSGNNRNFLVDPFGTAHSASYYVPLTTEEVETMVLK